MRILVIEDDATVARTIERILVAEGHVCRREKDGEAGLRCLEQEPFDMVLTDLQLPGMSGLSVMERAQIGRPGCPVILITGYGTTETAILAMRGGAFDYLTKPFTAEDLVDVIGRVAAALRPAALPPVKFDRFEVEQDSIIGQCRGMQGVYKLIGRVAATPATVLITGETGTGKELVARALHQYSNRGKGAFVVVNCAAIPEALLESELFGHEKGAFTGALQRRLGRFERAHGGTLFLDEVGELPLSMQVKLLRFLQDKVILPVGGQEERQLDVRLIAATNRDLLAEVAGGRFREDLYYRLNVANIAIPPLRERGDDIVLLLNYFNQKGSVQLGCAPARFAEAAIRQLRNYDWPGNVRQLENLVKQLLVRCGNGFVGESDVRELLRLERVWEQAQGALCGSHGGGAELWRRAVAACLLAVEEGRWWVLSREALERELVQQALERTQGHQGEACRLLGITMKTMREKLAQFGWTARQFKPSADK